MKRLTETLLLLISLSAAAQQKLHLNLNNSCSHEGEDFDQDIYGYPPSAEAQEMVCRICDAVGLQPRFEIRVANVPNATATIQGGKRLILYSENFMLKVGRSTGSDWAALGILAHEIGHHLNNDPLEEGESRPEIELKADQFSGRVLALMGASFEQAQTCVQNVNANGSETHPPRRARLEAIAVGWNKGRGINIQLESFTDEQHWLLLTANFTADGISKHLEKFPGCPHEEAIKSLGIPFLTIAPDEELPNSIRGDEPEMILVKGGTFQMGGKSGDGDEKCVHSVTVGDFFLGKFEITNAEFVNFLNEKGKLTEVIQEWINLDDSYGEEKCRILKGASSFTVQTGYENHPVIFVSWFGATAYAKWLSEKTGKHYRLPSEAEWEFAAKGGNQSKNYIFAGSNAVNEVAWYSGNSSNPTHPVGSKNANEIGLYDMSGNVWEWCQDIWHASYFRAPSNGEAWSSKGDQSGRVTRGGSWNCPSASCRSANRDWITITSNYSLDSFDVGFRVAHDK